MTQVVRTDALTRGYQLASYVTQSADATTAVQPWSPTNSPANAARSPVNGILVIVSDVDAGNVPGSYIEYGGPDLTKGNGIPIKVGDSALIPAPNAAQIWIVCSVAGMVVRGLVQ